MCEVRVIPEAKENYWCKRTGKWWVQWNGEGILVCTQHLPSAIERMTADIDPEDMPARRATVTVKRRTPHPENPKWSVWR